MDLQLPSNVPRLEKNCWPLCISQFYKLLESVLTLHNMLTVTDVKHIQNYRNCCDFSTLPSPQTDKLALISLDKPVKMLIIAVPEAFTAVLMASVHLPRYN